MKKLIIKVLEVRNNALVKFHFLSILLVINACDTFYSKDDYLKDYEYFIFNIKRDWKSYSSEDWVKLDKINSKYYKSDYQRFAGELKPDEIVRVKRYNFIFKFYKGDINLKSLMAGEYNDAFRNLAIDINDVIKEIQLCLNDFENEKTNVIINKLLEKSN